MVKAGFQYGTFLSGLLLLIACAGLTGCAATVQNKAVSAKLSGQGSLESEEILASDMSFDMETGEFSYTLPEDALVRVRLGIKSSWLMVRNLVDWELRAKGPHTEIWDKKDRMGFGDYSNRDDIMVVLSCLPADEQARKNYAGIIKGFRKSPEFDIAFPESRETADDGTPVLKGVVSVRITIDERDNQWLTETKFEVGMFIDTIFLTEDEEGTNPYNYQLNTKGFNDGVHLLIVNVVGYEGEIGTKSARFYVKNE